MSPLWRQRKPVMQSGNAEPATPSRTMSGLKRRRIHWKVVTSLHGTTTTGMSRRTGKPGTRRSPSSPIATSASPPLPKKGSPTNPRRRCVLSARKGRSGYARANARQPAVPTMESPTAATSIPHSEIINGPQLAEFIGKRKFLHDPIRFSTINPGLSSGETFPFRVGKMDRSAHDWHFRTIT